MVDEAIEDKNLSSPTKQALTAWKNSKDDNEASFKSGQELLNLLKKEKSEDIVTELLNNNDLFAKKSIWIIGGDGWAYDIGFGGKKN